VNRHAPLLAAGTFVAAITVAPIATVLRCRTSRACPLGAAKTQCQSPGNAEVYDAPPQVDYYPSAGGAT
jgi:hypothetical protein